MLADRYCLKVIDSVGVQFLWMTVSNDVIFGGLVFPSRYTKREARP